MTHALIALLALAVASFAGLYFREKKEHQDLQHAHENLRERHWNLNELYRELKQVHGALVEDYDRVVKERKPNPQPLPARVPKGGDAVVSWHDVEYEQRAPQEFRCERAYEIQGMRHIPPISAIQHDLAVAIAHEMIENRCVEVFARQMMDVRMPAIVFDATAWAVPGMGTKLDEYLVKRFPLGNRDGLAL